MRAIIYAALVLALIPVAHAQNDQTDASVKRAKACIAATEGKRLTDAEYRSYMNECLASTGSPQDLFESKRTIERRCNAIANDRQLTAEDRVTFMASCRRKGG
jgi:hypothetical protein